MRSIDSAFAYDGQLPVERNNHWRQLRRHIVRMNDALRFVQSANSASRFRKRQPARSRGMPTGRWKMDA
jgi:hypothetical protein